MKSLLSLFVILILIIIISSGLYIFTSEINTQYLNNESVTVISTLSDNVKYNLNTSNITSGSGYSNVTPADQDSFGFEFLSLSSNVKETVSLTNTLQNVPDMIIAVLGLEDEQFNLFITILKWAIPIFITILIIGYIFQRRIIREY